MPSTSEFRKGIKVKVDGDPYEMIECEFCKPGKGQALYRTKLRHLFKNTVVDRTYKSGDSIDSADVFETSMQYLYRDGDDYVFMHPETFEQPALSPEQLGENNGKWIMEGMNVKMVFYEGQPIGVTLPNHVVVEITYTEPGAKGDTAGNVLKPATVETGAEVGVPLFVNQGEKIRVDTRTGEYIERAKD